jgi:hypothetical protein
MTEVKIPKACFNCTQTPQTVHETRFEPVIIEGGRKLPGVTIPLPICRKCEKKFRNWNRYLYIFGVIPGLMVLAYLFLWGIRTQHGPWYQVLALTIVSALVVIPLMMVPFFIARSIFGPNEPKCLRATGRLIFKNRHYQKLYDQENNLDPPTCYRCRKSLARIDLAQGAQTIAGQTPILYEGVVCIQCKKIECGSCKDSNTQAPCSSCGGEVKPAYDHYLRLS